MGNSLDNFYKNQSLIYKYFLYFVSIGLIVFFFPREGKFKYEFQKGKSWQYENLVAPFDFSIKKTETELTEERNSLTQNQQRYYDYDNGMQQAALARYATAFETNFGNDRFNPAQQEVLYDLGKALLDSVYANGIFAADVPKRRITLVKDQEALSLRSQEVRDIEGAKAYVDSELGQRGDYGVYRELAALVNNSLQTNTVFNKDLSDKALADELSSISFTRGEVEAGKLIIAKGAVVESEAFNILSSLKEEYESELWKGNNQYFILLGYALLVALVLIMLLLFLKKYRHSIYANNNKVTFIFVNILLMVFITTMVFMNDESYVYVVPLCVLPLILKNFFDARLGLFVHVLTILILGFVVPNSFEYVFLQIIAGIVTILTVSELYKRANLFISVGQITLIYIVGYFAFHVIQEGTIETIEWTTFGIFLLNGMITLFAQPLIYMYEKIFGLVSDVSLLELSDTNSKLLKELANKAPGTFHHSLQVSNLAEAAANEIGANAMLVRVGALYHDIGKMTKPTFFTENQITNVNPHDDLPPKESAKIIIDHVIEGIELARKNGIPDRVIDFIRTHHGTSLVYYFYKKYQRTCNLN